MIKRNIKKQKMKKSKSSAKAMRPNCDEKLFTHYFEFSIPTNDELEKSLPELISNLAVFDEFCSTWTLAGFIAHYGFLEYARLQEPIGDRMYIGLFCENYEVEIIESEIFVKSRCYAIYENDDVPQLAL